MSQTASVSNTNTVSPSCTCNPAGAFALALRTSNQTRKGRIFYSVALCWAVSNISSCSWLAFSWWRDLYSPYGMP